MALNTIHKIRVLHAPYGHPATMVTYVAYTRQGRTLDTITVDLARGEVAVDELVARLARQWKIQTPEELGRLMA
jgi:hypothetical protein